MNPRIHREVESIGLANEQFDVIGSDFAEATGAYLDRIPSRRKKVEFVFSVIVRNGGSLCAGRFAGDRYGRAPDDAALSIGDCSANRASCVALGEDATASQQEDKNEERKVPRKLPQI